MRRLFGVGDWSVLIGFEPRDLWVGVFWDFKRHVGFIRDTLRIYVCVIPAVPVLLHRERTHAGVEGER